MIVVTGGDGRSLEAGAATWEQLAQWQQPHADCSRQQVLLGAVCIAGDTVALGNKWVVCEVAICARNGGLALAALRSASVECRESSADRGQDADADADGAGCVGARMRCDVISQQRRPADSSRDTHAVAVSWAAVRCGAVQCGARGTILLPLTDCE